MKEILTFWWKDLETSHVSLPLRKNTRKGILTTKDLSPYVEGIIKNFIESSWKYDECFFLLTERSSMDIINEYYSVYLNIHCIVNRFLLIWSVEFESYILKEG